MLGVGLCVGYGRRGMGSTEVVIMRVLGGVVSTAREKHENYNPGKYLRWYLVRTAQHTPPTPPPNTLKLPILAYSGVYSSKLQYAPVYTQRRWALCALPTVSATPKLRKYYSTILQRTRTRTRG